MSASRLTVTTPAPKAALSPGTTTLNQSFQNTVTRVPNRPALSHKLSGLFRPMTYAELAGEVQTVASALMALGIGKGDRVAILAENGVDWARVDLALLSIGAATVPIYSTLPANQVAYILQDSGSRIVFTGDNAQLAKIVAVRAECPDLEHAILFEGDPGDAANSMDSFLALGQRQRLSDDEFRRLWQSIGPDDMATLIYTSGTTGDPKGVELTHGNFIDVLTGVQSFIEWDENDVFLSFLPLCHIYERAMGHYLPMSHGAQIAYVEGNSPIERISKLSSNFIEVKPTLFLGMPRLYEKMKEKIEDAAAKGGPKRKKIFDWAIEVGLKAARLEMRGKRVDPWTQAQRKLADKLVFEKVRERVGGNVRHLISAGAPLPGDVMEFFNACGLQMIEGYGLTETTSVVTANHPGDMRPGSIGQPSPNVELTIAPDGEIICRGKGVMRRYWNKPAATAEAIDADGWFHTGDVGEWMEGTFLRITGRKKDLIVLSNGKKVAPQDIEARLKSSPYITDLALMGDGSQSVVAMIVPNFDRLAAELKLPPDRSAIAASPEAKKAIKRELDRLSAHLADFEKVRKFALMDHEFTVESGELTPTLKVKRHVLTQRYADVLAELIS
ncbi:MAG TPA: long-chain fatty acid--CoA ligase [Armatimonadota bacterium]|jgi:long-chain acyl-CoA synthetase